MQCHWWSNNLEFWLNVTCKVLHQVLTCDIYHNYWQCDNRHDISSEEFSRIPRNDLSALIYIFLHIKYDILRTVISLIIFFCVFSIWKLGLFCKSDIVDSTETDDVEVLRDNDMGGGHQQENGGYHGEQCEDYQAQSVQHHGSKLPITLCGPCVILIPDLLGDHPELLQDESQFPHTAGWQWSHLLLKVGKIARCPGSNFHLTIELSIFVDSVNTFNAFLHNASFTF